MTLNLERGGVANGGNLKIVECMVSDNFALSNTKSEAEIQDSILTGSTGVAMSNSLTIRGSQIVGNASRAIDLSDGGELNISMWILIRWWCSARAS